MAAGWGPAESAIMSAACFPAYTSGHRARTTCLAIGLILCMAGCDRRSQSTDAGHPARPVPPATAVETAAEHLLTTAPADPLLITARQRLRLRTLAAIDQFQAAPGFAPAPDQAVYCDPLALDQLIGTDWSMTVAAADTANFLRLRRAVLQHRQQYAPSAPRPINEESPDLLAALPAPRRAAAAASRGDLPTAAPTRPQPPAGPTSLAVAIGLADRLPPPAGLDPRATIAVIAGLWLAPSAIPSRTSADTRTPAITRPRSPQPAHAPETLPWSGLAWLMPALSLLGLLLAIMYARLMAESARMMTGKP